MTHEQRAELRRLAEAATPGPWELWDGCSWRRFGSVTTGRTIVEPIVYSERDRHPDLKVTKADGAFIAAANPHVILSLLAAIDRAERQRDGLLEALALIAKLTGLVAGSQCEERCYKIAAAAIAAVKETT